jgi:hypothetical protein
MTLVETAKLVFGDVARPAHFTNHTHCCECAEHDATFQAYTPDSISLNELGNPGWDPMCFATDEAFKFFFPAMVRLALEGTGDTYYLNQFLFHIIEDGPRNRRWETFSKNQRRFVVQVLEALLEQRAAEIDNNLDADGILTTIEIWSDNGV